MNNTDFKIIKFYEIKRDDKRDYLSGTLHIRFDIGLNIKGIFINKKKDCFFVSTPNRSGYDRSTNNFISYSTVMFQERDVQRKFIETLREKAKIFIEEYLIENPEPLPPIPKEIRPQNAGQQKRQESVQEKDAVIVAYSPSTASEAATEQAEKPLEKAAPIAPKRNWITPPERKKIVRKTRAVK